MSSLNQIRKYQAVQIETASPEALVVIAYDGLLKLLHTAKIRMAEQDIEKTHDALKKAQLLIMELMSALKVDTWEGGNNLLSLYNFMLERLRDANIKKQPEPIDEILPFVQQLRDAWNEAHRQLQSQKKKEATP